jgi:3-hydroxy-9,10-secoandrosta-1,3,5(10)-triene-9,17-dione monooxygenase reductase component
VPRACNHAPVDAPVHDPPLPEEQSADGERLRAVMRHVASPVTIITASSDGVARGATIGSFTSLSLTPPLISFNAIRGTNFHALLRRASRFAVHVLRDDQADLAEHFAQPDLTPEEQFAAVDIRPGDGEGPPILREALALVLCERWKLVPAGDHDLVIGRVLDVEAADNGMPLVYYGRAYRGVGATV